jgi:hypothetical protein
MENKKKEFKRVGMRKKSHFPSRIADDIQNNIYIYVCVFFFDDFLNE